MCIRDRPWTPPRAARLCSGLRGPHSQAPRSVAERRCLAPQHLALQPLAQEPPRQLDVPLYFCTPRLHVSGQPHTPTPSAPKLSMGNHAPVHRRIKSCSICLQGICPNNSARFPIHDRRGLPDQAPLAAPVRTLTQQESGTTVTQRTFACLYLRLSPAEWAPRV